MLIYHVSYNLKMLSFLQGQQLIYLQPCSCKRNKYQIVTFSSNELMLFLQFIKGRQIRQRIYVIKMKAHYRNQYKKYKSGPAQRPLSFSVL